MFLDHSLEDSAFSGLTVQYNYEMMTSLCSVDVTNIKTKPLLTYRGKSSTPPLSIP